MKRANIGMEAKHASPAPDARCSKVHTLFGNLPKSIVISITHTYLLFRIYCEGMNRFSSCVSEMDTLVHHLFIKQKPKIPGGRSNYQKNQATTKNIKHLCFCMCDVRACVARGNRSASTRTHRRHEQILIYIWRIGNKAKGERERKKYRKRKV